MNDKKEEEDGENGLKKYKKYNIFVFFFILLLIEKNQTIIMITPLPLFFSGVCTDCM